MKLIMTTDSAESTTYKVQYEGGTERVGVFPPMSESYGTQPRLLRGLLSRFTWETGIAEHSTS